MDPTSPTPRRRRMPRPGAGRPTPPALRKNRPETFAVRTVPRGARWVRLATWSALGAGPLALAAAIYAPPTTVVQAAPAPSPVQSRPPADPRGAAEMFVDLWLRADASAPDSSIAAAVRSLAPQVDLPKRSRSEAPPAPARVVALRTAAGPESWTVVVAAISDQPAPAASASDNPASKVPVVRYYAVSGSGGTDTTPVTIGGAPAEVAAPDAPQAPAVKLTHSVPGGSPLETSLGEFVRAYLSGGQGGGLERYLSPGLHLSAPKAAPYARVEVSGIVADSEVAAGRDVPADGAKAQVRIQVTGEDKQGVRWPLVYRAEVTARTGRWEVSALEAGIADLSPSTKSPSSDSVSGGAR